MIRRLLEEATVVPELRAGCQQLAFRLMTGEHTEVSYTAGLEPSIERYGELNRIGQLWIRLAPGFFVLFIGIQIKGLLPALEGLGPLTLFLINYLALNLYILPLIDCLGFIVGIENKTELVTESGKNSV